MINWPTAFVIAVAMICGAFLINKPSDAAGSGGGDGVTMISEELCWVIAPCFIHAHKGQLRQCILYGSKGSDPRCTDWLTVSKL